MIVLAALLAAQCLHASDHRACIEARRVARIEWRKCGPQGTVDWDDNPAFPPPHCNRSGWNPRTARYEGERR